MKKQAFFKTSEELSANFFYFVETNDCSSVQEHLAQNKNLIDCRDKKGYTALHIAAQEGYTGLAKLLLEAGADVNAINPGGGVVGAEAASIDSGHFKQKEGEKGQTALHLAAEFNQLEMTKLLLARNAKVDAEDVYFYTPLYYTLYKGYHEVAEELLRYNANAKQKAGKICGTLLHEAAYHGHVKIVKLLVEHGAEINSTEGRFTTVETPLHVAMKNKHFEIVNYLCLNSADTEIKDDEGKLPLMLSKYDSYEELFHAELNSIASCRLM